MENLNLKISASPHVRSKDSTSDIMFDVIIALVPAAAFGMYHFGVHAAILVAACILSAVFFEFIYQKLMHKKVTISDFSAVLTGLLLALNLPPEFPIWMAVVGSAFAIIVVKQFFGGLGQNFMNPALAARCFLLLSFSRHMTTFMLDGVSAATPLTILKLGGNVDISDMFLGYTAGTIGETSALAILIGALYLLVKRVISPRIPLTYIGSFAICIVIYAFVKDYQVLDYTLAHLCGGGLMLGAWFMATDYVTSPITSKGKLIYGAILGLLTFVLRIFGSSAEGVSYAIIISNLLVPLIEKATIPKAFGEGAGIKDKKKETKAKRTSESTDEAKPDKSDIKEDDNKAADKDVKVREKLDKKGIITAVAAILIITVVMGAALGVVYNVTKEPIIKANEQAKKDAYEKVYPGASDISTVEEAQLYDTVNTVLGSYGFTSSRIDEISVAAREGEAPGFIILVTNSDGYSGDIQMAVGISGDGIIQGIAFLSINETAGLGMEAESEEFLNQFIGKDVNKFTYTKTGAVSDSEIDAISGATITTSAVVDGINAAIRLTFILMGGN